VPDRSRDGAEGTAILLGRTIAHVLIDAQTDPRGCQTVPDHTPD
jgi:hypothetical protein